MKFNKFLLRILCLTLILAVACGIAAKLHVDNKEYKVEFDANGGTGVEAQYVVKGGLVTAPQDPTREGYTFLGWFYNEDKFNFETAVKGAMTLVAHWEKLPAVCPHADKNDDNKCDKCGADFEDGTDLPALTTYSIVYMDGANQLALAPNSYTSASTGLTLPNPPAKVNYEFAGWYLDAEFTTLASGINVNANANLTFYAKYLPVTYKVNYFLDGGVNAQGNVVTFTVEDLPVLFADPAKEGFEFKGWFTDANCQTAFEGVNAEMLASLENNTLNLYADWSKILLTYTVTYLDKDGNLFGKDTYLEGSSYTFREGYYIDNYNMFEGWVDTVTGETYASMATLPEGTTGDITVQAKFVIVEYWYNVNYYVNGELYTTASFKEGDGLATLLTVSQKGYEFDGWYDAENAPITSIPETATADVDLFGYLNLVTYSVQFFDGVNELDLGLSSYTISETDIILPELPVKEGYYPAGWYTADGTKLNAIAADSIGNLVLYARYENVVYTITYYNVEEGNNNPLNETEYTYGNVPTLYDPLNKEGFVFGGWYTLVDGVEVDVNSLEEYANQSICLYAKWQPIAGDNSGNIVTPEVPLG